jgi:hypothetical protein
MAQLRLISADSHVMEPADFWEKRLDHKFRDRAPRVVQRSEGPVMSLPRPGLIHFRWPAVSALGVAVKICGNT